MNPVSKTPANDPPVPWASRIILVLVAAVAIPIGASVLYTYSPTEYSYLPCTFNRVTGWHCPGCGSTRCCYSLLHGDIEQALAWNPLFVIFLPVLCYALVRTAYQMWTGKRMGGYRFPLWTTQVLALTIVAYWVLRNIPYEPFIYLAPHEVTVRIFS